ncbi:MAG: glucokinase [Alphaproteobacteria bacterium]|nr:glucokinase [Alphaproteobacteria bacterium]
MTALLADIGGTHARFAVMDDQGKTSHETVFPTSEHATMCGAVRSYLADLPHDQRPHRGAFAVACPVHGDRVQFTNLDWAFSIRSVTDQLGLMQLSVVNDFAAIAHALPALAVRGSRPIGGGQVVKDLPMAVLGPGTGLGVSGWIPSGAGGVVLDTEGGHVTLAARTDEEAAVVDILRGRFGHVSAERAISGPGLMNLYQALCAIEGVQEQDHQPQDITTHAHADPKSIEARTVGMFCGFLGTVAGDLALSLGARGGVFIAGGIPGKLGSAFDESCFRARFEDKGRFSEYLAAIPTLLITNPNPAFLGLAAMLTHQ